MAESSPKYIAPVRRSGKKDMEGLEQEIASVRKLIEMVDEQAREYENVKELLRILNTVSSASLRLARLLRAQRDIAEQAGGDNSLSERMDRILINLAREKGIIE
jgi:hypothetical protein